MSYAKILRFLEALPPEDQRLASRQYENPTSGCRCVIGRLMTKEELEKIKALKLLDQDWDTIPEEIQLRILQDFGISRYEVRLLQNKNDVYSGGGVRRWKHILKWLKEQG